MFVGNDNDGNMGICGVEGGDGKEDESTLWHLFSTIVCSPSFVGVNNDAEYLMLVGLAGNLPSLCIYIIGMLLLLGLFGLLLLLWYAK